MTGKIDYGSLMHEAMRGLIRQVLSDVARDGLPGEHHFFISFNTLHPGVQMADWLAERFPQDMTIVMQHWFEDLEVDEAGFSVTLNFGDNPERLRIPFDAILTFVDPSVEFGLRFETQEDEAPAKPAEAPGDGADKADAAESRGAEESEDDAGTEAEGGHEAEIVSLDTFRKS